MSAAPAPDLMDHIHAGNWVGVDEALARLGNEDCSEAMRCDAFAQVCGLGYARRHKISVHERQEILQKIIATGVRIPLAQADRCLSQAVMEGDIEHLQGLLAMGLRPRVGCPRPRDGLGPALYAAGLGRMEMLDLLLAHGADIHELDTDGCTAMFYATANNQAPMLMLLAMRGLAVDQPDNRGRTALMAELKSATPFTVETLLRLGASPARLDNENRSALDRARDCPDHPAAAYLLAMEQARLLEGALHPLPSASSRARL